MKKINRFFRKGNKVWENKDIWKIAMEQSAIDLNCSVDDFMNKENTVVISKQNEGRKKCYKKPMFCGFAYYGDGLVASVDEKIAGVAGASNDCNTM